MSRRRVNRDIEDWGAPPRQGRRSGNSVFWGRNGETFRYMVYTLVFVSLFVLGAYSIVNRENILDAVRSGLCPECQKCKECEQILISKCEDVVELEKRSNYYIMNSPVFGFLAKLLGTTGVEMLYSVEMVIYMILVGLALMDFMFILIFGFSFFLRAVRAWTQIGLAIVILFLVLLLLSVISLMVGDNRGIASIAMLCSIIGFAFVFRQLIIISFGYLNPTKDKKSRFNLRFWK